MGYDPDMGARPLRRVIQQTVEDPLSDALLSHVFADGDEVWVDLAEGDEIILRKAGVQLSEPEGEAQTN